MKKKHVLAIWLGIGYFALSCCGGSSGFSGLFEKESAVISDLSAALENAVSKDEAVQALDTATEKLKQLIPEAQKIGAELRKMNDEEKAETLMGDDEMIEKRIEIQAENRKAIMMIREKFKDDEVINKIYAFEKAKGDLLQAKMQ